MRRIILVPLLLLLVACSPSVTMPNPSPTVAAPQPSATVVPSPSATPEATATADLAAMPVDQAAQLILSDKAEIPSDWTNEQMALLAETLAEMLNAQTADQVYVDTALGRVCWDATQLRWRVFDHPKAEDCSRENLPPLIIAGYTNVEGREVFIDPDTGEEIILPKINLPELGEKSITELYAMSPEELINYSVNTMLNSQVIPEYPNHTRAYEKLQYNVSSNPTDHLAFPVFIYKNTYQKTGVNYSNIDTYQNPGSIKEYPTSSVLIPILDEKDQSVLFWLNIQQGERPTYYSFGFSSGNNAVFDPNGSIVKQRFGYLPDHSFGILVTGQTVDTRYDERGEPLLEEGVGIGNVDDISKIINGTSSIEEIVNLISRIRLGVLFPDRIIYKK